jgi:membrane protein DedA with SNARE-associated domain
LKDTLAFLLHHPYFVLCGVVFAEQAGLPLPAAPFLLAAGALAGLGKLNPSLAVLGAALAALLADLAWYQAGRRRGMSILKLVCRISLEPDSCVRRTSNVFARQGGRTLLVAKFLPGLSTVAPPLAGMIGMRLSRFALWDGAGSLLWVGAFLLLGMAFHDQLESVAELVAAGVGRLGEALGALFALWLGWKYTRRRRFIRSLRVARITPEELKRRLDAGEAVVIVDLRGSLDLAHDPQTLPGALRMSAEELETRHVEIPRDRDVVLYCT